MNEQIIGSLGSLRLSLIDITHRTITKNIHLLLLSRHLNTQSIFVVITSHIFIVN